MEKTLRLLDPKFEHIVVTIEETKNLEEISVEQLMGSLQHMKRNIRKGKGIMSSSSRRMSSQRRKKKASITREASTKEVMVEDADVDMDVDVVGTSTTIVTTKEEKNEQNVFRHYAWECRALSNRLDERVNYVKKEKEDNGIMLLACKNNDGDQDCTWYLDTGANNHMCGRRSMFVEPNESVSGNVSFGDESKIPIKGKEMTKED
ncbi:hypothetical protein ACFX16_045771 [Malus domestica]